ncbi:hypothetical protein GGR35_002407 [Mucilaginibacter phyllosphaerae]|uniref:Uncharacterized protein n=1 Tax=Mucilaginibacter phyllosphaerae TaxID=1812349 RepID=A0ABR6I9P4_9SPHI|nr:hypothetical protein [Mucilaginibacter phyllosphaerae]
MLIGCFLQTRIFTCSTQLKISISAWYNKLTRGEKKSFQGEKMCVQFGPIKKSGAAL